MPRPASSPVVALMRSDRFAAGAGVRLVEVREGLARARLRLAPGHLNGLGVAQGGAIFTLADLAFAAAANARGAPAVALDASITFVRAAVSGTLTAEAREEALSRRTSVCTVRVTDGRGELVALFRGTAYRKDSPPSPGREPAPAGRGRRTARRASGSRRRR